MTDVVYQKCEGRARGSPRTRPANPAPLPADGEAKIEALSPEVGGGHRDRAAGRPEAGSPVGAGRHRAAIRGPVDLVAGANDIGFDIDVDWDGINGPDGFGFEHNMHLRNDGRLMLLDNDNGRGLVFTVDEVAKTAVVDATYDTYENFCGPQGTAMDTKAGNAVVACDTEWVREYDLATSAMIWEGELTCRNGGQGGFGGGVSATRWYPLDSW